MENDKFCNKQIPKFKTNGAECIGVAVLKVNTYFWKTIKVIGNIFISLQNNIFEKI